ncbi:MAG TPA: hypothetical protein PK821_03545, partial [Victivallales bacterium]|nr:hypothetical protein [Victivallales bacterium]
SIVGTIAFVGRGRISAEEFLKILEKKDRSAAFDTAPPQGLFLQRVFYEGDSHFGLEINSLPFHS